MCVRPIRPRKLDTKWRAYVGGAVYQNEHGDRIHVGGIVKMQNRKAFEPQDKVFRNCLKVMTSRNELSMKRRGLMLYVEYLREVNEELTK